MTTAACHGQPFFAWSRYINTLVGPTGESTGRLVGAGIIRRRSARCRVPRSQSLRAPNRLPTMACMAEQPDDNPQFIRQPVAYRVVEKPILGYGNVWFTTHADVQMKVRGVKDEEVFSVIRSPTRKNLPTQPGRKRYRRNKSNYKAIDVVFEEWEQENALVIVTVITVELQRRQR